MMPEVPTSSPFQVVALVNAAVLGLLVIAAIMPGSATKKNWQRVKSAAQTSADTAVQLVPALSALVLQDASSLNFALFGAGTWLLGVGVGAAVPGACKTDPSNALCDTNMLSTKVLANGLTTAGTSFGVGAFLAYMKNMKLE